MLLAENESIAPPAARLDHAIDAAQAALLARQDNAGFWCAELQGDSILESEYILMRFMLGQEHQPELPKIARYLRLTQEADGGWNNYPGGPPDISSTVKAYFALKLMGDDPQSPHMRRCCQLIRSMGGAEKANSFSKFYFAALGQISYDACPSIPPEIAYLPKWCYFNLYHVSAWTRVMILPLGIVTTIRPVRKLPAKLGMSELYLDPQAANRLAPPPRGLPRTWKDFFLRADQILKAYNQSPIENLREAAIKKALDWILARQDNSEGLGAIFPSMVYMLIVFRLLGYADDHPRVTAAEKHLRDFFIEDDRGIRLQPCLSPVWDTGIAMHALAETGIDPQSSPIRAAVRWLLSKECRGWADWAKNCPHADLEQTSSWYFEFANPHYPDTDDTAMVAMSLKRLGGDAASESVRRGANWLMAMQNSDGGWAAFDRTEDRPILEKIPFADHNAMQDPSCPDITGRALECLGHCGFKASDPAVTRAVEFLKNQQDADGPWWGRWGVNYIYGAWQVLMGLHAVGLDMNQPFVQKAAAWLRGCQKPDGSWGETPRTYDDPSLKGTGPATASQTAWAVMAVLAAAGPGDPAVQRGVQWLMQNQAADGAWDEDFWTGTGFPRAFYLKYHYYRLYFPLMALARFSAWPACDTSMSATITVATLAEIADDPAWLSAFADQRKDARYYRIVEETLNQGFEHRYFLIDNGAGQRTILPFFMHPQDILAGASPRLLALAARVRKLFPRFLTMRTLMAGCAAGEGRVESHSLPWVGAALAAHLRKQARRLKCGMVVMKEFHVETRNSLRPLCSAGFTRAPSLPMTRLNIQYANFDDYMTQALSKVTRKSLRRKFKTIAEAPAVDLQITSDISACVDELLPLYLSVYERSPLHFEKLTREFFLRLGAEMPDKVKYFIWRQSGRPIAFSLCMMCGDTLYDEYLGLDYSVALDRHLYFHTLRDIIQWAMDHGYKWYCSSALNYDPKLHLKCELVPLDLYVSHTSRLINFFLGIFLPILEPTRNDKTLKQFANYTDLWGER